MKTKEENEFTISKAYKIISTGGSFVILICLTLYAFYHSFQEEIDLYSWHPSLMTLGFALLMAEGILIMSKDSFFMLFNLDRGQKVTLHWILETLAGISITTGSAAMFILKTDKNYPHFQTWHSITGLTAIVTGFVSSILGVFAFYSSLFKNYLPTPLIKFLKLMHICLGILALTLGGVALSIGFYTRTFIERSSESIAFACVILLAIATFFTMQFALRTAYSKTKKLYFTPDYPKESEKKSKMIHFCSIHSNCIQKDCNLYPT